MKKTIPRHEGPLLRRGSEGPAETQSTSASVVAALPPQSDSVSQFLRGEVSLVPFRPYQERVFWDHQTKTLIVHWSRQIGKSYTLAAWAVDRLLLHPGRLVTVLSNSRANGLEFVLKCQEVCRKLGQALEVESNHAALDARADISEDMKYDLMRGEVRVAARGQTGRILVLAANPRTARGFSGDLILDEFAFHENSALIWEAAEPIISSNPDFLCRIASTGNGKRNMFYQLISEGRVPYFRMRRSDAWAARQIKIYSAVTGKEITPDQARREASDKRAYDQNYECAFNDESAVLLTQELINAAERPFDSAQGRVGPFNSAPGQVGVSIDEQTWSAAALARMAACAHPLFAGQDVGRMRDLSVLTVLAQEGQTLRVVGMLRMAGLRGPAQLAEIERVLALPRFQRLEIDMTGLGTFLLDWAQDSALGGDDRVGGVNFSSTEPVTDRIRTEGRKLETARVTEIMATELLGAFEDKRIEIPADAELRDDLRKPEKIVSPGGRVSIAAARDEAGHADHFWSLALAVRAAQHGGEPAFVPVPFNRTTSRQTARRERELG